MLQLTTLDQIMRYMGAIVKDDGSTDTTKFNTGDQLVLTEMIAHVSNMFESYCNRVFTIGPYTVKAFLAGRAVYVEQYPISSVSSVMVSPCGRSSNMQPWTDYEIGPDDDCIVFFRVPDGAFVQIAFQGGLATDANDVIARFPALNGACNLQVATLWRRHNTADRTGMSLGTGTTSWNKEYKLLDDVTDTLDQTFAANHNIF